MTEHDIEEVMDATEYRLQLEDERDKAQTRVKALEGQVDACKNVISFARSELRKISEKDVHVLSALAVLPKLKEGSDERRGE